MDDCDAEIVDKIKSWYKDDISSLEIIIDLSYRIIAINEIFKEAARNESDYGKRTGIRLPDELLNWSHDIILSLKYALQEVENPEAQGSNLWAIQTLCTYFGYDTKLGRNYKYSSPFVVFINDEAREKEEPED